MTDALKQAIIHFNRVAGQYRRYYGIEGSDFLQGKPRTIRQVEKALAKMQIQATHESAMYKIQAEQAKRERKLAQDAQLAQIKIDNIMDMLDRCIANTRRRQSREAVTNSVETIRAIIFEAIDTWADGGDNERELIWIANQLQKYASEIDSKLEKLALAIYDKEYNTNSNPFIRDDAGDAGRAKYKNDISRLAKLLRVPVPDFIY